jgi:hypothetical protein
MLNLSYLGAVAASSQLFGDNADPMLLADMGRFNDFLA